MLTAGRWKADRGWERVAVLFGCVGLLHIAG
jgi:hypothetical protein